MSKHSQMEPITALWEERGIEVEVGESGKGA